MTLNILVAAIILILLTAVWLKFTTRKVLKISRTRVLRASPEVIFPYINNPSLIHEWNPFMEGDPAVRVSYGSVREGKDAKWSWEGRRAGVGSATIVESDPHSCVVLRLDFKKPFHVTNYGSYRLIPHGNSTEIIWTIEETALIPRVLANFVNLEKLIGRIFEKGLEKLESLIERKRG